MRRSKNIEPGMTPALETDSMHSEWGQVTLPPVDTAEEVYGELEFGGCDLNFIDRLENNTPTPREELYFPSAGEIAFSTQQELEVANAEMLELLNSSPGLEGVVGNDDRIRVQNTLDPNYPWSRKICSLIVTTQSGQRLRGTGWIAGERLVMTAAHNLYIHERGGWPLSVTVIPGRNGFRAPFNHFTVGAEHLVVTRGWKQRRELASDLGGIVIPVDYSRRFIPQTGYFAIRCLDDRKLARSRTNIVGYPVRTNPVGSQWWHGRRVLPDVGPQTFQYNVDTTRGQSGSPAFIYDGTHRFVVGIHNVDAGPFNQAVRINQNVLKKIRQWKRDAEGFPINDSRD